MTGTNGRKWSQLIGTAAFQEAPNADEDVGGTPAAQFTARRPDFPSIA